ncbi:MAG: TlpA family protein disulfide reductase [Chloroflexi bacterium]|nr:TlpA family protein disulfide reductase [Chloroflexota bacterium]
MSTVTSPSEVVSTPSPAGGSRSARIAAFVVAGVVVALLALLVWGLDRQASGSTGEAKIATRPAPLFELPLFDGTTFKLADTGGRPVLINFWASWCIPCIDEAAALERASRIYGDRVLFIGVNVQDTDANARDFLRRYGVSYANGRDATGAISIDYGMSGVPESYFVDRQGRIVRKWQGPLDDSKIAAFLDELLR